MEASWHIGCDTGEPRKELSVPTMSSVLGSRKSGHGGHLGLLESRTGRAGAARKPCIVEGAPDVRIGKAKHCAAGQSTSSGAAAQKLRPSFHGHRELLWICFGRAQIRELFCMKFFPGIRHVTTTKRLLERQIWATSAKRLRNRSFSRMDLKTLSTCSKRSDMRCSESPAACNDQRKGQRVDGRCRYELRPWHGQKNIVPIWELWCHLALQRRLCYRNSSDGHQLALSPCLLDSVGVFVHLLCTLTAFPGHPSTVQTADECRYFHIIIHNRRRRTCISIGAPAFDDLISSIV